MPPVTDPARGDGVDLRAITASTLAHYDAEADAYHAATRDHDVSQNVAALYRAIATPPPWTLLDFGCGPGRDLATFVADGHVAVGLDGAAAFVARARGSGATVLHQDFVALDLPVARFDGVFANASLQHVPRPALPRVLAALAAATKPGGAFVASIPHGDDEDGWNGARYGVFHSLPTWRRLVTAAGFVELAHYLRPTDAPPERQRWLVTVWRRP